jgi:hypothetical protein
MAINPKSSEAIIIGILVPSAVFVLIIVVVCARRFIYGQRHVYLQVNHGLDDEEMQFKKSIEMAGTDSDDLDGLFADDSDTEEIQFDAKDLDRLNMLEKFRNNLVASAQTDSATSTSNDEKLDQELRI